MNRFLKRCFFMLLGLFGVWLILSEQILQSRIEKEQDFCFLQDGWYQWDDSGNPVGVSFPGQAPVVTEDTGKGIYYMSVERTLPETITEHGYLCLRAPQQDISIYIGEELRLCYTTDDIRLYGKNTDSRYLFLPLLEEDGGKRLRIETESTSRSYIGVLRELYYGTQAGIIGHILRENAFVLLIILILILFGILTVAVSIVGSVFLKRHFDIGYLGWFDVVIAFWLLCETNVLELLFPDLLMLQTVPDVILMLCTIPAVFYVNEQQKERYAKSHYTMILLAMTVAAGCTLLHILNLWDYYETMPVMAFVVVCTILEGGYTFIKDIRSGHGREMRQLIFGCVCCALFGLIEILNTFLRPGTALGGYLAIGMLIQLSCAAGWVVLTSFREERKRQAAIQANQEKTGFLMKMSHDIRTPLNTIMGMNEVILREAGSQEVKSCARNIDSAGQYLLSLLSDLMDISQIETGNLKLKEVEYDVRSMLHNLSIMAQTKLEKKEAEFRLEADSALPVRLYGDRVRLEQAVGNLLTNAIKYTEQGYITLRMRRGAQEGAFLNIEISVEDTGSGIRPEDMNKLFTTCQRLEQEHNPKVEGYGLGLVITRQLLSLMGSKVEVKSEYGRGSRFSFAVKQRIVDSAPVGNIKQEPACREDGRMCHVMAPKAVILVVDDNEMNRVIMKKLLQPTRILVDTAGSGEECLQAVRRKRYDLIFMDDMMPRMSGVETLHAMERQEENLSRNAPVIMLTANAVNGAKERYVAEGFRDYLAKPFTPNQLELLLKCYIPQELQDNYRSLSGVDLEMGMMYCGGSKEIYREVLEVFREMGETMPELLEKLYQEQDWAAYQIQVHSLKSSALNIGARGLSAQAKELEKAAKSNKLETVVEFHGKMMIAYRELLRNIEIYLKGIQNEENTGDRQ